VPPVFVSAGAMMNRAARVEIRAAPGKGKVAEMKKDVF
jgi:hypothetical protein